MEGGNVGDRHVYRAGMVLAEMVHRLSVLDSCDVGDISSALGRAGGSGC